MRAAALLLLALGCAAGRTSALGFEPRRDGFSFANFRTPPDAELLGPAEMAALFGPAACRAGQLAGCVLTAAAEAWARSADGALSYGQCEGMALLAAVIFLGDARAAELGADSTFALHRSGPLERAIARWSATQLTSVDEEAPPLDQLLSALRSAFARGEPAALLGLYQAGRSDGHTVLPVELTEYADGDARVGLYDPNAPGALRELVIAQGRWSYDSVLDSQPIHYQGDAGSHTLTLLEVASRLALQPPPF